METFTRKCLIWFKYTKTTKKKVKIKSLRTLTLNRLFRKVSFTNSKKIIRNHRYNKLRIDYSWLLLSLILDISNFALSRTIYLVPWSFSTWSVSVSVNSRFLESWYLQFLPKSNKFSGPLCSFILLSPNFFKISKMLFNFFSPVALFTTAASAIAAIVPARMSKDSQVNYFYSFFRSIILIQFFLSLEYSIKLLFKEHFTENHGAF